MAGAEEGAELKGMARIFNAQTTYGRANVAKLTYGTIALIILYNKLKPKKK